jgi:hypothetical protein
MRELELNFDDLSFAFEDPASDSSYYLDLDTGSIIMVRHDLDDVSDLRGQIELEPERYVFIPKPNENQLELDVQDFAFRVTDPKLKSMIELALESPNKYASLRAVLQKFPGEMENWQEWKKQGARQRALRWLEAHDIKMLSR